MVNIRSGAFSVLFLLGLIAFIPARSNAQTAPSDQPPAIEGGQPERKLLMLPDDPRPCSQGLEGNIRYSSAKKRPEVCNGTDWVSWAGVR